MAGWQWLVDTTEENGLPGKDSVPGGEKLKIGERSVAVLVCGKDLKFIEESE